MPVTVVGRLRLTSKTARDKTIAQFDAIQKYSHANEPGVGKYAITVADDDEIVAIEEYASQQVSDEHLASPPVQELIGLFGGGDVLAGPPTVYTLDTVVSVQKASGGDLYYAFAVAKLGSEADRERLESAWRDVAKVAEGEEGTMLYSVLRDPKDGTVLYSVEGYTDKAAFEKHCTSTEVGTLVKTNEEVKGEMGFTALKLATGWISR